MGTNNVPEIVGLVSLIALGLGSLAAAAFWLRFRAFPAGLVFLSMAAFVVAALTIQVFPGYALVRDPETGEQAVMLQYQTLRIIMYATMGVAALIFPVSFWWFLRSVVPKQPGQANDV